MTAEAWESAIYDSFALLARTRGRFTADDARAVVAQRSEAPEEPSDWRVRMEGLVARAVEEGIIEQLESEDSGDEIRLKAARKSRRRRRSAAAPSRTREVAPEPAPTSRTASAPPAHEGLDTQYPLGRRISALLRKAVIAIGIVTALIFLLTTGTTFEFAPQNMRFMLVLHLVLSLVLTALSTAALYLLLIVIDAVFDIADRMPEPEPEPAD